MDVVPEPPVRLCPEPPIEVVPEPLPDAPLVGWAAAGELGCCETTGAEELVGLGLLEDTGADAAWEGVEEAGVVLVPAGAVCEAADCRWGARRCAARWRTT